MNRADAPNEIEEAQIRAVLPLFPSRDRLLVELGFQTGLRLSELTSLRVGDVWRDGRPATVLRISRRRLKGGRGMRVRSVNSRVIPLNQTAQMAVLEHIAERPEELRNAQAPLFIGWKRHLRTLTRQHAGKIIRKIFCAAGLDPDRVWAGHSLRRRFVRRIYDETGCINTARQAAGHRWIHTCQLYLGLEEEAAHAAILRIGTHQPSQREESQFRISAMNPNSNPDTKESIPCASSV